MRAVVAGRKLGYTQAMKPDEQEFLRSFFRAVADRPIDFDAQADVYVEFYKDPNFEQHDPVRLLMRSIEYSQGQSVQLLSGFRGSGKSTELRRLKRELGQSDVYKVVLIDIEDYLSPSQPIDVSDFLIALAAGFGDALVRDGHLGKDPAKEGYWTRFSHFVTRTQIDAPQLKVPGGIGLALKSDPSFRQTLQERMTGHLGALVEDVRGYVEDCVKKVKEKYTAATEVVLLLDSLEHLRGSVTNAAAVQDSVLNLFARHADKLHFNFVHVVYTVPPYLKVLQPNLGSFYEPGGFQMIPTIKVHRKADRAPFAPALELMAKLISARGDCERLFGDDARAVIDELSLLSGGHLRDFLRLFAEIIRRADRLPVSKTQREAAVQQVRSEFLPIPDEDAVWLDRIAISHDVALKNNDRLHDLARYFDSHLALSYRNGEDWYDIHPLVRELIGEQAKVAKQRWEKG